MPPNKTKEEEEKEQAELDKLVANLSERRRRTFLRYLLKRNQGKDLKENDDDVEEECKTEKGNLDAEIRKKFEELKLINRNMDEELGFLHDLDDSDDASESDDDSEDS